MTPVDYAGALTPTTYRCSRCKATGCKLWRQYQTFANVTELFCVTCAEKNQGEKCQLERPRPWRSDVIGWLVPAVPTEDGETFWGYTSVPNEGRDWWGRLPLHGEPGKKEWSPGNKVE